MKNLTRAAVLISAFLVPVITFAQQPQFMGCTNQICNTAQNFIYLINTVLVPLIFAVAFIVFLWGVFRAYIFKRGEEEVKNAHQLILWGIVGFVIMLSIWGIVNVVSDTFGLSTSSGNFNPTLPFINTQQNP